MQRQRHKLRCWKHSDYAITKQRIRNPNYRYMKRLFVITTLCFATACSDRPTPGTGAVVGGISGAGVGAIVGSEFGSPGAGAAIGAATGAGVGAVVGSQSPDKQEVIEYQEDYIANQQKEIYRQGKELDQIKRQRYWDQRLQQHK